MNYLRQPEKTPSVPKRDDLSVEGEEEKREADKVLLTRAFCARSRSTCQAVVPSFTLS